MSVLRNYWKNKKVAVTGANGFIGSHIVRRLVTLGADVCCVVEDKTADNWRLSDLSGKVSVNGFDIVSPEATRNFYRHWRPQVTFHSAAYGVQHCDQEIMRAIDVNVKGAVNLFNAATDIPDHKFINLGTRYESYRYHNPVKETHPYRPSGIYGITKAAACMAMEEFARKKGALLRTGVLFGVYGPMESVSKFVPNAICSILSGKPLFLTGCKQVRDYLFVDDAVNALLRIAEIDVQEVVFSVNVGFGQSVSLKELVVAIQDIIGKKADIRFGKVPYRPDEIWRLVPDLHLCKKLLDWTASVPLETGLKRTIRWYRELHRKGEIK